MTVSGTAGLSLPPLPLPPPTLIRARFSTFCLRASASASPTTTCEWEGCTLPLVALRSESLPSSESPPESEPVSLPVFVMSATAAARTATTSPLMLVAAEELIFFFFFSVFVHSFDWLLRGITRVVTMAHLCGARFRQLVLSAVK